MAEHSRCETIRNLFFLLAAACLFSGCSVATWSVEQAANPDVEIVVGQTYGEAKEIVGFTPLGDLIVLTKSGRLMLLDAQTGERKMDIESGPYNARPGYASLASNGIVGFSYGYGSRGRATISVWDTAVCPPKQTFRKEHDNFIASSHISSDGLAMAVKDRRKGEVSLWDPKRGQKIRELDVPAPEIRCNSPSSSPQLKFSSNGKYLAVLSRWVKDKPANVIELRIFSVPEGIVQHYWSFSLQEKNLGVAGLFYLSDDGRRVLFYVNALRQRESLPGRWWLCDVPEGKKILDVGIYTETNVSPFMGGYFGFGRGDSIRKYIISRKEDGSDVCAYDLATGKRCGEWELTRGWSRFFLFGDTLVRQYESWPKFPLEFWNLKTNQKISTSQNYPYCPLRAISPDSRFMAFAGMKIFRRSDGKQLLELRNRAHETDAASVRQYVFSRDSKRLAFLCDGTVGIIDLESLQPKEDEKNGSEK